MPTFEDIASSLLSQDGEASALMLTLAEKLEQDLGARVEVQRSVRHGWRGRVKEERVKQIKVDLDGVDLLLSVSEDGLPRPIVYDHRGITSGPTGLCSLADWLTTLNQRVADLERQRRQDLQTLGAALAGAPALSGLSDVAEADAKPGHLSRPSALAERRLETGLE